MFRSLSLLLVAAVITCVSVAVAKEAADEIKVDIHGTLKTGVIAIGAETTGITITAGKTTWELDLGDSAELKKQAEALNGQRVHVVGVYLPRPGVEVKVRHIVKVSSLKGAVEQQ